MAIKDCPKCGAEIEPKEFPYEDGVQCLACGAMLVTDWEDMGDEVGLVWWIVGEVAPGPQPKET